MTDEEKRKAWQEMDQQWRNLMNEMKQTFNPRGTNRGYGLTKWQKQTT